MAATEDFGVEPGVDLPRLTGVLEVVGKTCCLDLGVDGWAKKAPMVDLGKDFLAVRCSGITGLLLRRDFFLGTSDTTD